MWSDKKPLLVEKGKKSPKYAIDVWKQITARAFPTRRWGKVRHKFKTKMKFYLDFAGAQKMDLSMEIRGKPNPNSNPNPNPTPRISLPPQQNERREVKKLTNWRALKSQIALQLVSVRVRVNVRVRLVNIGK